MELLEEVIDDADYIETTAGNKISRQTIFDGSENILINGKCIVQTNVVIRGDLTDVKIGRYCIICRNSVIKPTFKEINKGLVFLPFEMGDHVFVGENAIINAATVGSFVYIGKNVIIGRGAVLKDCCMIEDNSVIPNESVIHPYGRYSGTPAVLVSDLPDRIQDIMINFTRKCYHTFVPGRTYQHYECSISELLRPREIQ